MLWLDHALTVKIHKKCPFVGILHTSDKKAQQMLGYGINIPIREDKFITTRNYSSTGRSMSRTTLNSNSFISRIQLQRIKVLRHVLRESKSSTFYALNPVFTCRRTSGT